MSTYFGSGSFGSDSFRTSPFARLGNRRPVPFSFTAEPTTKVLPTINHPNIYQVPKPEFFNYQDVFPKKNIKYIATSIASIDHFENYFKETFPNDFAFYKKPRPTHKTFHNEFYIPWTKITLEIIDNLWEYRPSCHRYKPLYSLIKYIYINFMFSVLKFYKIPMMPTNFFFTSADMTYQFM